ncbi:alpha-2,3-sialyltransferase [uncultured Helicobacter sp.]|uniref:alpha-2,3-sialyltransferase n=1 Tax=uncultured Helicobacter sp. TaxID=175537 RepID=UPI00374EE983
MKKALVVAGNGPSLREIDYTRLPKEYDVFRCNLFFCEEAYYLGKQINAYFFHQTNFFEYYFTLTHLVANKEYEVSKILCPDHCVGFFASQEEFAKNFPDIELSDCYVDSLTEFSKYKNFNAIFYNNHITSGIYMCAVGTALGYKEIYISGIDLYEQGTNSYAFKLQSNTRKLLPLLNRKGKNTDDCYHNAKTDIQALQFLQEHYDVRFYSLSPTSPLSQHIDLAPVLTQQPVFTPEKKPAKHTADIMIPEYMDYERFHLKDPLQEEKIPKLKKNIYYRIFRDLFKLPSDIKHYVRYKL